MDNNIEQISVEDVFINHKYIVPIYQRNYAWGSAEISTLVDDMNDVDKDEYFLGSIVFLKNDKQELEVIDGQQRLTTLYLLYRYLGNEYSKKLPDNFDTCLVYSSRPDYEKTLNSLKSNAGSEPRFDEGSQSLADGYKIIEQKISDGIKNKTIDIEQLFKKLKKICMLLVEVPHDTDLNHYFEIMNTRGEQLEQHEILKTRMYSELSDPAEKAMLVKIWNSCMNMGRYIQVGLTKGKTEKRDKIFGDNWDEFVPKDFDDLCGLFNPVAESNTEEEMSIFDEKATDEMSNDDKDDEDLDNFQHLITFPSLLMHCGNLMENDMEGDLNDGKLLNYFSQKNPDKNYVKKFAYTLLKARFYLDNYMIHREKDNQEEDEFVIKRGHRTDAGNFTSKNTFSNKDDDESYNDETTRKVIMIQSCLRVSYTSPKQMYWITDLLKTMFEYHTAEKIIQTCENYFRDKLRDYFEDKSYCSNINFRQAYQKLPRIIYFYLDYLLWRDGYSVSGISINEEYKGKFRFIFRSPIDHFEPLDSSESYKYEESPEETQWKHSFGNLSCITTSLNFQGKADRNIIFSDEQLLQSPKLYIMAKIKMAKIKEKNAYKFDRNEAKEHGEKMFNILLNNLKP